LARADSWPPATPSLARRVRRLTSFGFDGSREALCVATNAKLSEYAAAVGLAALDGWPADRLRWFMAAQAAATGGGRRSAGAVPVRLGLTMDDQRLRGWPA
jgi:hypothetical protein